MLCRQLLTLSSLSHLSSALSSESVGTLADTGVMYLFKVSLSVGQTGTSSQSLSLQQTVDSEFGLVDQCMLSHFGGKCNPVYKLIACPVILSSNIFKLHTTGLTAFSCATTLAIKIQ